MKRRTLAALLLLAVVAAVCLSLGRWQLDRAAERRGIAQAIEAGRQQAPLALTPAVAPASLQPWRAAQARGVWRHDLTVLIDNRNLDGKPGLWLATPLVFGGEPAADVPAAGVATPGVAKPDAVAVLVLRGWMARPLGQAAELDWPRPRGEQTVAGELAPRVPRMFELPGTDNTLPPGWPAAAATATPRVQNLDLDALAQAAGLRLLPAVLMQTDPPAGEGLAQRWPEPSVDADKNVGYALQWFSFAAIAAIAALVVAYRSWRRRAAPPDRPRDT